MSEIKHTPGPWECQIGHSDWGLPCSHIIVREGETGNDWNTWIAEIPSITPYCAGASRKERDRAATQLANARLMAAAPEMLEALHLVGQSAGWQYMTSETRAAIEAVIDQAEGSLPMTFSQREWNFDIGAAPKSKTVTVRRTIKGEERVVETSCRAVIWAASRCGNVTKSYWVEETQWSPGRWCMFGTHDEPVAWMEYVEGEYPCVVTGEGKSQRREYPNGRHPEHPFNSHSRAPTSVAAAQAAGQASHCPAATYSRAE